MRKGLLLLIALLASAPAEAYKYGSSFNEGDFELDRNSIQFDELFGTPLTPGANKLKLYALDDGGTTKLYTLDSSGTEVELGAGGGGGSSIVLDLGDDGSDESAGITEIATAGDTNSIFSEPSDNKLKITLSNDWPKADLADNVANADYGQITVAAGVWSIDDGTVSADDLGVDSVSSSELNATGVKSELEGVLELQELQGAVTDAQVPAVLTLTPADNAFTLQDEGDTTKQMQFQLSGISAGNTRILTVQDGNYTLAGTDRINTYSANQTYNNGTFFLNGSVSGSHGLRALASITSGQTSFPNGTYTNIGYTSAGVSQVDDSDGAITWTGLGNGNDESLTMNLDDGTGGANTIEFTSSTGVTRIDFTSIDVLVPTEVYDATNWDGDNTVPTKDAVRDKIEALSGGGLADPGGNGVVVRTALDTTTARTITGTANQITVTDGDGVSGNPTLSTPQDIHTGATPQFARLGLGQAADAGAKMAAAGQYFSAKYTLTDGATVAVDWNNGNVQYVVVGGDRDFTFSNPKDGGRYILIIKQDGTGGWFINSWPANTQWPGGGVDPDLNGTANRVDVFSFVYDATNDVYYGTAALNFAA